MGITGKLLTGNDSDFEKTAWRTFTIQMVLSLRKQNRCTYRIDAPYLLNVQQYFKAEIAQQLSRTVRGKSSGCSQLAQ